MAILDSHFLLTKGFCRELRVCDEVCSEAHGDGASLKGPEEKNPSRDLSRESWTNKGSK